MIICICKNLSESKIIDCLCHGSDLPKIIKDNEIKSSCKKCVPYLLDLEKTVKSGIKK